MGEGKKKTWKPGEIPKAAKVWTEVSGKEMKQAQAAPAKVKFEKLEMGLAAAIHEMYEATRTGVEKLLTAAVTETAEMGKALDKIEKDYVANQDENKQKVDKVGE